MTHLSGGSDFGSAGVVTDLASAGDLVGRVDRAWFDFRHTYRPGRIERVLRNVTVEARAAGDDHALAAAHLALAALARYRQDLRLARKLGREALRQFEREENHAGQACAHLELAKIDLDCQKDPEPQMKLAREAMVNPSHEIEARIEYVKARAALRQGKFAMAGILLKRALTLFKGRDHSAYYQARYLAQLGFVERMRGASIAREHLVAAYERAERGGFRRVAAYCLLDLGQIAIRRKHLDDARKHLTAAAETFHQIGDELGEAHAYSALGAVWRLTSHMTKSFDSLGRAIRIYTVHKNLAGEALARRRLAQTYIDLLAYEKERGEPFSQVHYERAAYEVARAHEQFEQLHSLDGKAAALATAGRLSHVAEGVEPALAYAMAAVKLLGQVRGQFRQGLERLEFGRLHSWIFGFAMQSAAESNDAAKALRIAAIMRAEALGGAARWTLKDVPGELGGRLREIFEREQGARPSASDAVRLPLAVEDLREWRDLLFEALDHDLAQALTPPLERPQLRQGCYRLCVQLFEDDLYVLCEGPDETDAGVERVKLSRRGRSRIEAAARAEKDAIGDARPRRWEELGALIVPRQLGRLRSELVSHRVEVLEIEPAHDLVNFPFGSVQLDGHLLDELTCVLLSPSDLPSFLWRGQGDRPPPCPADRQAPPPEAGRATAAASLPEASPEASFQHIVDALMVDLASGADGGADRSWSTIELMEIATGEQTLKRLFDVDPAVAPHFLMTYEQYRQEGLTELQAVRAAKASHRRGCGALALPPMSGAS